MLKCVFLLFCVVFSLVCGGLVEPQDSAQTTSGLLLFHKFMDDIFNIKNDVISLKSEIQDQSFKLRKKEEEITELKAKIEVLESQVPSQDSRGSRNESGATYVRWGRTDCADVPGTEKVYQGFAAGDYYAHTGGGVELLCLPQEPIWGQYSNNRTGQVYNFVYGAEYEIYGTNSIRLFGKEVAEQNIPCVVCQSVGRPAVLRIPGRTKCYGTWTKEYTGYLFAGYFGHQKSTDYTCIDSDPQFVEGGAQNRNGRLLYPVEANCAADYGLQCPPYQDGRELPCVICTK